MRPLVLSLCAAALFVSAPASANPGFPTEIPRYMKTTCNAPDCVLCHVSDVGQCGEIDKPFGKWLMSSGLSCANGNVFQVDSIDSFLDEAKSTSIDSNCDGIPDYQQLQTCDFASLEQDRCGVSKTDGGAVAPVENTIYGCSTSRDPLAPSGAALGVVIGIAALSRRKRRFGRDERLLNCGRRPSSGRGGSRCDS